jgi:hypothetical protein
MTWGGKAATGKRLDRGDGRPANVIVPGDRHDVCIEGDGRDADVTAGDLVLGGLIASVVNEDPELPIVGQRVLTRTAASIAFDQPDADVVVGEIVLGYDRAWRSLECQDSGRSVLSQWIGTTDILATNVPADDVVGHATTGTERDSDAIRGCLTRLPGPNDRAGPERAVGPDLVAGDPTTP